MKKILFLLLAAAMLPACCSTKIYISPDGDDAANGSRRHPLATVAAAVDKASAIDLLETNVSALNGKGSGKAKEIEIVILGGTYEITETVTVEGFHTPLFLRAGKGQRPVFSGEKQTAVWEKVSDKWALEMLPDPEKVFQTDLSAAGISDFGLPISDTDRFEFYYKGRRQTLARWPNDGFAYAGVALGSTEIVTYQNIHSCKEPILSYVDDRISGWAEEKAPCAHGYWQYDWFDLFNPIEIDPEKKILTVGGEFGSYGFRDGCRFRGVNLLSELDEEGEFWLDRDSGLMFWYAPEGFDASGEETRVTTFKGKDVFLFQDCKNVTLRDVDFEGSRGGAVSIIGGENVLVEGCSFRRFGQNVITVDGGKGHKVIKCEMSELGAAGIIMAGGDRLTLEPADFEVSDCSIETLSLYHTTYQPCIRFGGVGMKISHNLFRDCPSSALRLDGSEILVEYNIFEDLVKESDDQGGIDMHNNYAFRGVVISHNYFHNIGDPEDNIAAAVRFDDRISGMRVENNFFNFCGSSKFGAVQIHAGQDNHIGGNVFYNCTAAFSMNEWTLEKWLQLSESDRAALGITPEMDSLTEYGKLYLSRYPEMAHMLDKSLQNKNYASDNLIVRTPKIMQEPVNIDVQNTTFLPDCEGHDFAYWTSEDVLKSYGLPAMEFSQIGPRK